ncbi:MAG TPA: glycosyltransferase family 2 protein [bacterium]|nr:glycosyltransferase family 2 protein [bacterium]HPN36564.1 glycosyltransferase family 2 protein [bacterium]
MKLIIQIPCYNEAQTLPVTLAHLPRKIEGVDAIEILVVDDGSEDETVQVARKLGVHHIVRLNRNKGLATGFTAGLDACLRLGADLIVNTDADNQYAGEDIAKLVQPILAHEADLVIGDRNTGAIEHFSWTKKRLQWLGSWFIRQLSGSTIPDATSGFRALSRDAALRMNVLSKFTYTLETIIQAGKKNIAMTHVPVEINPKLRESRLFSSNWSYIKKSLATIVRIYTMYEPLKMFSYIGGTIFGLGLLLGLRFMYYYLTVGGAGHIQSLILAAVLLIVGFQIFVMGLLADIIGSNRQLIENILYRVRKMELQKETTETRPS